MAWNILSKCGINSLVGIYKLNSRSAKTANSCSRTSLESTSSSSSMAYIEHDLVLVDENCMFHLPRIKVQTMFLWLRLLWWPRTSSMLILTCKHHHHHFPFMKDGDIYLQSTCDSFWLPHSKRKIFDLVDPFDLASTLYTFMTSFSK